MRVGGIHWTTLLDYPGRVAASVFTSGCNLRCPFCHNPELVLPDLIASAGWDLAESFYVELEERKGFLDAVVISGGEPTLQADLPDVLRRVKQHGYLVKLDTNGTRPEMLEQILLSGLADFVAMDVKAPADAYRKMAGVAVNTSIIGRSMDLIKQHAPQYEFRTTAAPGLLGDDLLKIGRWLDGARAFGLQRFHVPQGKRLVDDSCREMPALQEHDLDAIWQQLRSRFDHGGVRP